ncbi:MAG TPA: DUF1223 domain-containing protein [Candidatus Acidoferrales bacterium]|nr:DUF1223 domain-containing protein [Candidatus Acidoferrales bacterium]
MKKGTLASNLLGAVAGVLILAVPALNSRAQSPAPDTSAANKPVVVELFTAEGCSDCPPAEALLQRMEQQPLRGVEIIPLEEHVDYWNQYGWIDPYSSGEWTARQQEYVAKAKGNTPYTPEMVVEGDAQFVGSNGRAAQQAIEKAVSEPQTQITIGAGQTESKNEESFAVTVGKLIGSDAGDAAQVWLAVTEDGLHSAVTAGENAGHTLSHAAVLRSLHKIGVASAAGDSNSFAGNEKVKLNSSWKRENLRVVVFVQDKKSLKILGAASAKVTG